MSKESLKQLAPFSIVPYALIPDTYAVNLSQRRVSSVDSRVPRHVKLSRTLNKRYSA